jgi:hypothetical protein
MGRASQGAHEDPAASFYPVVTLANPLVGPAGARSWEGR